MEYEEEFFSEEDMLRELRYLAMEGFINVEFDPEHPGSYKHAIFVWKSDKELLAEVEKIAKGEC